MKAYLRRDDFMLVGLRKSPENSDEIGTADWNKAQIIAKANITLHMDSQTQVRTREINDDDEKTAYDLWTALESTYTRTNTQAVQNLKHRLDTLLYSDGADWDEHFSKFMATLSQRASLGEEFSEKEKNSRLIRSLPKSFSAIAMVASFLDSFEKVEQAIRAAVDKRKNPHNPQSNNLNIHSQGRMPAANFT